jgi:hypothetical protein
MINVIRFTNPSVYGEKFIEEYKRNDIIKIPTIFSTSYQPSPALLSFTSIASPMVIFYIRVSEFSMKNFICIESASKFPQEHEIIFLPGARFKIIRKSYRSIKIPGRNTASGVIQKLVVEMVIAGDNSAEISLNGDDDLRWEEDDATENQIILPDLKNDDVEGGGLKNIDTEMVPIKVFSKSELFLMMDELKPDKETKEIVPQFDVLFPYYLRNDSGIEMKCEIMGCKYLDYGILKVFPELKNQLVSARYVLNIPSDEPSEFELSLQQTALATNTKSIWENLSDKNINNKNINNKNSDISHDSSLYNNTNTVVTFRGGHDLSYIIHVTLCLLLILIVVCMLLRMYSTHINATRSRIKNIGHVHVMYETEY